MGRHKRLAAAINPPLSTASLTPRNGTEPSDAPTTSPRQPPRQTNEATPLAETTPSATTDLPDVGQQDLLNFRPQSLPTASRNLVTAAARVVQQVPDTTPAHQRALMGELCRLLVFDQAQHGRFDPPRALRPDLVDFYLKQVAAGRTAGGLKSLRERLYRLGRTLQPDLYPDERFKAGRPKELQPPHTAGEVQRLYRFGFATTPALSRKVLLILDVITGAGARPQELLALRGQDITSSPHRPAVTLVSLTSMTTGAIRNVPVLDKGKSERLLAAANAAGDDGLLVGHATKNALNRVQAHIRKQQPGLTMSTVRLRHYWLVDLLNRDVPTALVHQLADLNDSHSLAGLRRWMRTYNIAEATTVLEAAA